MSAGRSRGHGAPAAAREGTGAVGAVGSDSDNMSWRRPGGCMAAAANEGRLPEGSRATATALQGDGRHSPQPHPGCAEPPRGAPPSWNQSPHGPAAPQRRGMVSDIPLLLHVVKSAPELPQPVRARTTEPDGGIPHCQLAERLYEETRFRMDGEQRKIAVALLCEIADKAWRGLLRLHGVMPRVVAAHVEEIWGLVDLLARVNRLPTQGDHPELWPCTVPHCVLFSKLANQEANNLERALTAAGHSTLVDVAVELQEQVMARVWPDLIARYERRAALGAAPSPTAAVPKPPLAAAAGGAGGGRSPVRVEQPDSHFHDAFGGGASAPSRAPASRGSSRGPSSRRRVACRSRSNSRGRRSGRDRNSARPHQRSRSGRRARRRHRSDSSHRARISSIRSNRSTRRARSPSCGFHFSPPRSHRAVSPPPRRSPSPPPFAAPCEADAGRSGEGQVLSGSVQLGARQWELPVLDPCLEDEEEEVAYGEERAAGPVSDGDDGSSMSTF
eukprot:TRINITY_DN2519_c0_g1_i1.p1 TRINITY_DN2519_c0_g1~~TRINITY_DN2519_c0_g1_i1.p1  ORF type:complete len:501 (+),score=52.06 TRINITY_DN2519_c0_g1_i1:95-1597(+)